MADRYGETERGLTGIVSSVIKASGGNLEDFAISQSTAHRARNAIRKEEYIEFYKTYMPPKHAVVGN